MANQPVLVPIKAEPKFQRLQSSTVGVAKCITYPTIHHLPAIDDGEDVEDDRVEGERNANYILNI